MKVPRMVDCVGHIDDDLISDAASSSKPSKKNAWLKWVSVAACFAVVLAAVAVGRSLLPGGKNPEPVLHGSSASSTLEESTVLSTGEETYIAVTGDSYASSVCTHPATENLVSTETRYSESYVYTVENGKFSSYIGGKVIAEEKIGERIADVSVTAGWRNGEGEALSNETLRAQVYLIEGISDDVAAALKFIDKGDALTTTHYYVIMNPDADLSAVEDYIIAYRIAENYYGEETAVSQGAIVEAVTQEETVVLE